MGFEAPNFTQVFLHSPATDSGLLPHSLVKELPTVTIRQPMTTCTDWRKKRQKWSPTEGRILFSKPIHADENRNGPPRANQGLSGSNAAAAKYCWNPLTSLCATLSANTEPKSQRHCWISHHKWKVVWPLFMSIAIKGLTSYLLWRLITIKKLSSGDVALEYAVVRSSYCPKWVCSICSVNKFILFCQPINGRILFGGGHFKPMNPLNVPYCGVN